MLSPMMAAAAATPAMTTARRNPRVIPDVPGSRRVGETTATGESSETSLAQVIAHDTDGCDDAAEDTQGQSDEDEEGGRTQNVVDSPPDRHRDEHRDRVDRADVRERCGDPSWPPRIGLCSFL